MSLAKRILGRGSNGGAVEDGEEPGTDAEQHTKEALPQTLAGAITQVFDNPPHPAYDMTREINFSFDETATITHSEGDNFVEVQIETPTTTIEFEARIDGYTALFGEVDAEYISVGSYALNVYYPRPEEDMDYFVRRLYYYEDEDGIGGEQHREDSSAPHNPVWKRSEHLGSTVSVEQTESHLRVYDWREQMLTHDKPTPKDGEVVLRYQDSPNSGGNRSRDDIVLSVNQIRTPVSEAFDIDYISVDTETGELELYGQQAADDWYVATVPIAEDTELADVSWDRRTEYIRPSQIENLVWVRNPAATWVVDNKY